MFICFVLLVGSDYWEIFCCENITKTIMSVFVVFFYTIKFIKVFEDMHNFQYVRTRIWVSALLVCGMLHVFLSSLLNWGFTAAKPRDKILLNSLEKCIKANCPDVLVSK